MQLIRSVFYSVAVTALSVAGASLAEAQVDSSVKVDSTSKLTVAQDQAVRGMTVFTKTCVECHTKSDVTGPDFKIKWNGRPVWDLFDVIRTTMPDDNPGTMTQDQYIDVVAYLVRINGAAAGGAALAPGDTAGLKKAKMEIQVPSPNIDSVKVDGISLGGVRPNFSPSLNPNSAQPRMGMNRLFVQISQHVASPPVASRLVAAHRSASPTTTSPTAVPQRVAGQPTANR